MVFVMVTMVKTATMMMTSKLVVIEVIPKRPRIPKTETPTPSK